MSTYSHEHHVRAPQHAVLELMETFFQQRGKILHPASSGVKARRSTRPVGFVGEVGNDQPSSWFEHPSDFRQSLPFEGWWQMMHHQGREHHIEGLIGEGERLDHAGLKIDGQMASSRFRTGASDLLAAWVNARDATCTAQAAGYLNCQRARAATHIQLTALVGWIRAR